MKNTYYVYFQRAYGYAWWHKFFDINFTHCFIIKHVSDNVYTYLEHLTGFIHSDIYIGDPKDLIQNKCIKVEMEIDPYRTTNILAHMNCAILTKKSLGIDKPFILTPKQLYTYLLSIGGERI